MNKISRLKELRTRMDENVLDMNNIVRLLEEPKYSESSVLTDKFNKLMKETKELNEEYQMLKTLKMDVA